MPCWRSYVQNIITDEFGVHIIVQQLVRATHWINYLRILLKKNAVQANIVVDWNAFSDLEVNVALLFCSYFPSSTPQRPHYFHPHSFAAFLWVGVAFSAISCYPNTVTLSLAVFENWIVLLVTLTYWVDKKNIKSTHALSNKSFILNAKENRFSPGKMVSWLSTASIFHFTAEKWPRMAKTVQNQWRKWRQPAIVVIFR